MFHHCSLSIVVVRLCTWWGGGNRFSKRVVTWAWGSRSCLVSSPSLPCCIAAVVRGCRAWVLCSVVHEPGHAAFSHSRWLVLGLGVKVEVRWAWALRQRRGGGGHLVISVDGTIVTDERWPSRHQVDATVIVDEVGCDNLDVDMTVVDDEVGGRCRCGQCGSWTAQLLTWMRWDMDRAVVDVRWEVPWPSSSTRWEVAVSTSRWVAIVDLR